MEIKKKIKYEIDLKDIVSLCNYSYNHGTDLIILTELEWLLKLNSYCHTVDIILGVNGPQNWESLMAEFVTFGWTNPLRSRPIAFLFCSMHRVFINGWAIPFKRSVYCIHLEKKLLAMFQSRCMWSIDQFARSCQGHPHIAACFNKGLFCFPHFLGDSSFPFKSSPCSERLFPGSSSPIISSDGWDWISLTCPHSSSVIWLWHW